MGDWFFKQLIQFILKEKPTSEQIAKEKIRVAGLHKLPRIPSNFDILLHAEAADVPRLKLFLKTKPTRTLSGVAPLALFTKPSKCPHGKCAMCPGGPKSAFGETPQSYTGTEPAARRAARNNYDAYRQVFNRLEQYTVLGHPINKIEIIIMGGTFPALDLDYQNQFVTEIFSALNSFSDLFFSKGVMDIVKFKEFFELPGDMGAQNRVEAVKAKVIALKKASSLEIEQEKNETSFVRCVAMCIETRPDYCKEEHITQMLKLGCTRVELGVQAIDDKLLEKIQRGHSVEDSIIATKLLRNKWLKVGYHLMIGLPGSSKTKDINMFKTIFSDEKFLPDFIKIYPCLVVKGTELFEMWNNNTYGALSVEDATEIIFKAKKFVPEYTRIMRIMRDIPENQIIAGPKQTNLRQLVLQKDPKCKCIRCREYGTRIKQGVKVNSNNKSFRVTKYKAAKGTEYFIQCEDAATDALLGFCRLRIANKEAGIRELHVYGEMTSLGETGVIQHTGIGKKLIKMAEKLAKGKKLSIISGVGVRGYYEKLGYKREGGYMVK